MSQKGFSQLVLLVIVGVVIVAAGGGAWYYRQSGDQNKSITETQVSPASPSDEISSVPIEEQKPQVQEQAKITPPKPADKPVVQKETVKTPIRDDLGCWPPSCSVIPDPQGKQACIDWKAGKTIQWPGCGYYSGQPACQKLCEAETKTNAQGGDSQTAITPAPPATSCSPNPIARIFNDAPYYTGPLIDDHFHMPQFFKIADHPEAPVLDQDISKRDVACLFTKNRVKSALAFYGIPSHLKTTALKSIKEIKQQYPGTIQHFLEFVVFPGYSVDPTQIKVILDTNKGLFKGYGELSLYLPHYANVKPNDPAMKELYKIAGDFSLIVMMHPLEGQQQAVEEALRDNPNTQFLFHAAERLSSANMFLDTFLEKYPNAHYSVDIVLFGEAANGRPLLDAAANKQDFITKFKQNWQNTLNSNVALWKSKIEKHPDQFLWGTDRGASLWNYDQEIAAVLEEYSRAFIGQIDPSVQEKFAYKNAEVLLKK